MVDGVWRFHETHGVPIDMILSHLFEHDCVPDWVATTRQMVAGGMRPERAIAKLREAIADADYPPDYRAGLTRRFDEFERLAIGVNA